MDFASNPADIMSVASAVLLLLLTSNRAHDEALEEESEDNTETLLDNIRQTDMLPIFDSEMFTQAALHNFRLCNVFSMFDADLGYWVLPRSTTWFSCFLLGQYDEQRWLQIFRISKPAVFSLAQLLDPYMRKKDTKYRLAIPVVVRVACALFKLTHAASLLMCSELFAVGRSTVSLMVREVVQAINVVLISEISWPVGQKLLETEADFKKFCGLPGVLGAIDGTHVSIHKPKSDPADYFYFKSGGYTLNCQAVVDCRKRFTDLFLGMPGSTNDARCLQCSSLYYKGMHTSLWDPSVTFHSFSPYLLGDSGYPLMSWLLVPNRRVGNLPVVEALFNRKLSRGRGVVENTFGILKQTFRELLVKSNLEVSFMPDVILACAILHNVLLGQSQDDVERFLQMLHIEGLPAEVVDTDSDIPETHEIIGDEVAVAQGVAKRHDLGVFLALERNMHV